MRLILILLTALVTQTTLAKSYAITIDYSYGPGIPISGENIELSIPTKKKITSRAGCIKELNSKFTHNYVLGRILSHKASDAIIKCTESWSNNNCAPMHFGCLSQANFGNAKHIHASTHKTRVPDYLLLNSHKYEVIQAIVYTIYPKSRTPEILYVNESMFDKFQMSAVTGRIQNCKKTINTSEFISSMKDYFKPNKNIKSLTFNCFMISKSGYTTLEATKQALLP